MASAIRIAFVALSMILMFAAVAGALSQPFSFQGKEFYVVTSTDPGGDTGDEVCAMAGKQCIGYTVSTSDVCMHFHPDASESSTTDGDVSGVYCDSAPQTGVCASESDTCHTCPQCIAGVDCSTPIGSLYREMYVECGDKAWSFQDFISAMINFFRNMFSNFGVPGGNNTIITNVTTVQIGPYPNKWACEFFQVPWPGVNKKHVSCPYETLGAAINEAADEFCRTVMGSAWAVAEVCDSNGLIVCTHPCETTPATTIPSRCAFDNDRPRGSQAPPLKWCQPTQAPSVPSGEGRPENCDETAYHAHPGYNENRETWDRYTAETDGVCQSRYGAGVVGPCVHIVQVSVQGNPYYLCWYNNP